MNTLTYTGSLVITSCWCGIRLAIPDDLYDIAQRNGTAVHCPLGHTFVYGDTKVKQLEAELKRAKDTAASWRARADQLDGSLRATKGHVTRLRRRTKDGECPFCGQHLRDLERHVTRMHENESVEALEV